MRKFLGKFTKPEVLIIDDFMITNVENEFQDYHLMLIDERKIFLKALASASFKTGLFYYPDSIALKKPEQWLCLAGLSGSKLPSFAQ